MQPSAPAAGQFKRSMKARHGDAVAGRRDRHRAVFNTGYIISTTGALGTLLAYLIGALVVYLVMLCTGELSVAMPETGAFTSMLRAIWGRPPAMPSHGCIGSLDGGARLQPDRRQILHAVLVPAVAGVAVVLIFCAAIFLLNVVTTRFSPKANSGFR